MWTYCTPDSVGDDDNAGDDDGCGADAIGRCRLELDDIVYLLFYLILSEAFCRSKH